MHLSFASDRLLAVVAHPDDAELLCAGTLARAKAEGAAIGLYVLCQGDKGQPAEPIADLASVRKQEAQAAASLLGCELFLAGVPDAELSDAAAIRGQLVEALRQFRPTLVLAHAANDYHPDHRAASALAEAASWYCASPGHQTRSPPLDKPPAVWWMDTLGMTGFEPEFFVDISRFAAVKHEMLRCHASQLQRGTEEAFAPLEELAQRQYRARGAQAGVDAAEAFRACQSFKRARAW